MRLFNNKEKNKDHAKLQPETPYYKIFPILAITLFFSHWFAQYSYNHSFPNINELFTGKFLQYGRLTSVYTWLNIITLLTLILILVPLKDNSPKKWGIIVYLSFVLFLMKNMASMPSVANHAMMMFFLSIGYFIIVFAYIIRGKLKEIFVNTDYLPLMRASLIVMYFFGTFHKINSDFLLEDGCWSHFYNTIPLLPDFLKRPEIALPLGGYGTLVLEAFAMIMLFFPRTKYWGMILGMSFHFIIGITTHSAAIAHFSAFAFALHMSFLSTDAPTKFLQSKLWIWLNNKGRGHIYIRIPFALFLLSCFLLSLIQSNKIELTAFVDVPYIDYIYIKTMWVLYAVPMLLFVFLYGKTPEKRSDHICISKILIANIATLLLFLNSITPYIGLKSNADLAMFSNLRTEWQTSNHYIIRKPLSLFPYLNREYYIQVVDRINNPPDMEPPDIIKQNTWEHIFMTRRTTQHWAEKYKNAKPEHGETPWLEYKDHEGNIIRIDATTKEHFLLEKPGWWARNYLYFTTFKNVAPRPCSSR